MQIHALDEHSRHILSHNFSGLMDCGQFGLPGGTSMRILGKRQVSLFAGACSRACLWHEAGWHSCTICSGSCCGSFPCNAVSLPGILTCSRGTRLVRLCSYCFSIDCIGSGLSSCRIPDRGNAKSLTRLLSQSRQASLVGVCTRCPVCCRQSRRAGLASVCDCCSFTACYCSYLCCRWCARSSSCCSCFDVHCCCIMVQRRLGLATPETQLIEIRECLETIIWLSISQVITPSVSLTHHPA